MDADADFHLVVCDLEERRAANGRGARGERDAHRSHLADHLVADPEQLLQAGAFLGGGADRLDHEEVAGHTAPADRPGRVLDGNVVVDQERSDLHAIGFGQLPAHVPGRPVAGVVVDDVQDALGGVQHPRGLGNEVDRRSGEDVAWASAVEHALPDDHRVGRLMARPGTLDDRNFVGFGHVRPIDQVVLRLVLEDPAARQGHSL